MRPLIGVIPLWDDEKDSIWMLPGYLDGIREAGGIPVIFPLTDDEEEIERLMDLVQGVVFTGGQDVSPQMYGETPIDQSVECCAMRDRMEKTALTLALEQDKSVLGICRGLQFMNVALGGTLYQDLPSQYHSELLHRQNAPYDIPAHDIKIKPGTPLHELIGKEKLSVNSCHHQAIKTLAPSLSIMATAPDELIEGVYRADKTFFWGVQWHPEFAYKKDETQRKIFEAFIKSLDVR